MHARARDRREALCADVASFLLLRASVDDTLRYNLFVAPRSSIAARLVLAAGNVVGQRHQRRGARGVEAGQLSLG
jgi:hypothetical protein